MDGMEFTGTGFCVGDNVTFICDILSNAHLWTVAGSQMTISRRTIESLMFGPYNMFSLALSRPLPNDSIISYLSVIAYSGFNAVVISCGVGVGVTAEPQTSIATLLGNSSKHLK